MSQQAPAYQPQPYQAPTYQPQPYQGDAGIPRFRSNLQSVGRAFSNAGQGVLQAVRNPIQSARSVGQAVHHNVFYRPIDAAYNSRVGQGFGRFLDNPWQTTQSAMKMHPVYGAANRAYTSRVGQGARNIARSPVQHWNQGMRRLGETAYDKFWYDANADFSSRENHRMQQEELRRQHDLKHRLNTPYEQ